MMMMSVLFWGVIIFMVSSAAMFLTTLHLRRFSNNPMRSTIVTNYAPTDFIPFPAVTICNTNRILLSKIEAFINKLDLDDGEEDLLRRAFPQLIGFIKVAYYNTTELTRLQEILERNDYVNSYTILKKIGQSCKEMMVQCRWNGDVRDCGELFEESYTMDGLCCSFNFYGGARFHFQPNYTKFTGWHSGLTVTINPMNEMVQYSSTDVKGVKVSIHNPMEFPGFKTTHKVVSAGFSAFFQISATKLTNTKDVEYLPIEQRQCLFAGEKKLKYHTFYFFSNCMAELYARYIHHACDCVPFYYSFSKRSKCNISMIPCMHKYFLERFHQEATEVNCPSSCENTIYRTYVTSTKLNDVTLVLTDKNKHKVDKETGIRINVFFIGTHTLLSRDVYTSTLHLLSSIGGIYGLFMGCSFITILEIIYYCSLRFLVNLGWLGRSKKEHKGKKIHRSSVFQASLKENPVYVIKWNMNPHI